MESKAPLDRRLASALGAVAGVVGVLVALAWFYPVGRLFDPSVGGDEPIGLLGELVLGTVAGLVISPVSAAVGALVGWLLGGRQISIIMAVGLIPLAGLLAIGLAVIFNGGLVDRDGLMAFLWIIGVLGAAAGTVAVLIYEVGRRSTVALQLVFAWRPVFGQRLASA